MNPVTSVVKRAWLLVAIVVVAVVAGSTIYRLHRVFGVHDHPTVRVKADDDGPQFRPKRVTYEVFGPAATARITYLDPDARVEKLENAQLPWSASVSTNLPSVTVNILAQSDAELLSCRILINGAERSAHTETGLRALTICQVSGA